jgi:signal transduction histidine kinase
MRRGEDEVEHDVGAGIETDGESRAALIASRARLLAAADADRGELQRQIHDGAQQRLVHALIVLKLARGAVDPGSPAAALVEEALTNVEQATHDLRDVVRRVRPRSLTFGGLPTGLPTLLDDLAVPAALEVSAPRLDAADETTAYLVVAAALRPAVLEQTGARRVELDVCLEGGTLVVEIGYDSPDAAGPGLEDALTGVRDRVRAARGRLLVGSAPRGGSSVRVELPVHAVVGTPA